jgi:outer membrane protein assembly factor BamD (BamD/ComL family)
MKIPNRLHRACHKRPASVRSGPQPGRLLCHSLAWAATASALGLLALLAPLARAADPAVEAAQALADGIPAVAIEKLRLALAGPLPDAERSEIATRLAEALLATDQPEEAARAVAGIKGNAATLVRGRALLTMGNWHESEQTLRDLPGRQALADRAEALHHMGRNDDAIKLLTGIDLDIIGRLRLAGYRLEAGDLDGCERELRTAEPATRIERQHEKYLRARLLLARGQFPEAQSQFESLGWEGSALPEPLRVGTTLCLAFAREKIGGAETADQPVEEFISQNPGSRHLPEMFARLDELYSRQEDPPEATLEKWAADEPAGRAAYARFYLALSDLRQDRTGRGIERIDEFTRLFPDHPLCARAHLEAGRILAGTGDRVAALERFDTAMRKAKDPDLLAEIEIAAGTVQFWAKEFLLATSLFGNAANRSQTWRSEALYYSAISWLSLANFDRFAADRKRLGDIAPEGWHYRNLLIEEGLALARRGDPRAVPTLKSFVAKYPHFPETAEAKIALAELAFLESPPRIGATTTYLRAANDDPASKETLARAEALAVYAADAPGTRDEDKVIQLGQEFLSRYPESPLKAEIRMKLGQVYFRREDYLSAQREFQMLAREQPESPLAETALYLAGESALRGLNSQSLGTSIALFGVVAKREGSPLAAYARLQQGIAQSRLGNLKEAIPLFDATAKMDAEAEVRFAAAIAKADNLIALGETDPAQLDAASDLLKQLAADPEITSFWQNQALYKRARCFQKSGKSGEALTALYDIIAKRNETEPEFYWYYRAGFDAAQMIEERGDWSSAVGIYRKIAAAPGPRAAEAAERARRLRLEHFVWEE